MPPLSTAPDPGKQDARAERVEPARFERLVVHTHALGPRPVGEVIRAGMAANDDAAEAMLEHMERLMLWTPQQLADLRAADFPPRRPLPVPED